MRVVARTHLVVGFYIICGSRARVVVHVSFRLVNKRVNQCVHVNRKVGHANSCIIPTKNFLKRLLDLARLTCSLRFLDVLCKMVVVRDGIANIMWPKKLFHFNLEILGQFFQSSVGELSQESFKDSIIRNVR
jgi:hypothetical protein